LVLRYPLFTKKLLSSRLVILTVVDLVFINCHLLFLLLLLALVVHHHMQ
jgi:hypothetical protein